MKAFDLLLDYIFPPRCPFCNKVKYKDSLCCDKCKFLLHKCGFITSVGKKYDCVSAFPYVGVYKEAVLKLKYSNNKRMGYELGGIIYTCVQKLCDIQFDCVTEVPMSKKSFKNRGYNQAEYIARGIEKYSGIKYVPILIKAKNTVGQHTLNVSQRKENVKNVYKIKNTDIKGKNILLVDDICTTGYTLAECARIIMENGAKTVICASFVRGLLASENKFYASNKK